MAIQIASQGVPVYIISLEMSMEQIYGRILMALSDVSPENLRMHGLTATEIAVAKSLNETTSGSQPIYIDLDCLLRPMTSAKAGTQAQAVRLPDLDYINQVDTATLPTARTWPLRWGM